MENQTGEQPLYVLAQKKSRSLIPKIISYVILGAIFYVGVMLNISLLELDPDQESIVQIVSLIILLLTFILGIYLTFHKANQKYLFYKNRRVLGKKQMFYVNIQKTQIKTDIVDKIFKTYSIPLAKEFFIRNIPLSVNIQQYLQQLVTYSHNNQQQ